jgi:mycoredoxin
MTATHPVLDPDTVTVYGAGWCGDCRRSKRLLDSRATTYAWVDTGTGGVRDELRAAGYEAIPVIVLPDGTILMEPSDAALTTALDRLAAESGDGPAG